MTHEEKVAYCLEVGALIARKRIALGMSQCAMAAELGIHRNTLARWERGAITIEAWVIHAINRLLRGKGPRTR